MEIRISTIDQIQRAAREFINLMPEGNVFAFYGKMGAGKTTFIKAVCEVVGVEDVVTSPTFAIVNEYRVNPALADGTVAASFPYKTIHHFDFYRIKKLEEVYDMGYEDYFYGDGLCLIEWPELVEELLPDNTTKVMITEDEDGMRRIVF